MQGIVLHSFGQLLHSDALSQFLDQDFDKDTRRRSGFVLVQMDGADDVPADSVRGKEVSEELSDNSQAICFVAVNGVVVLDKGGFEELIPHAVDFAKTLTNQAEEFVVGSLLGTTLDDHRWKFVLEAWW